MVLQTIDQNDTLLLHFVHANLLTEFWVKYQITDNLNDNLNKLSLQWLITLSMCVHVLSWSGLWDLSLLEFFAPEVNQSPFLICDLILLYGLNV